MHFLPRSSVTQRQPETIMGNVKFFSKSNLLSGANMKLPDVDRLCVFNKRIPHMTVGDGACTIDLEFVG